MCFVLSVYANQTFSFKCETGSCLATKKTDGDVSDCNTANGQCGCGSTYATACTGTRPKCLVTADRSEPSAEGMTANCQVIIVFTNLGIFKS